MRYDIPNTYDEDSGTEVTCPVRVVKWGQDNQVTVKLHNGLGVVDGQEVRVAADATGALFIQFDVADPTVIAASAKKAGIAEIMARAESGEISSDEAVNLISNL